MSTLLISKVSATGYSVPGLYYGSFDFGNTSHNQTLVVTAQDSLPVSVTFNSDGTKMYMDGNQGNDISEYSLTVAYDISTATLSQSFSIAAQDGTPYGHRFNDDGSKMYLVGDAGNDINEYDLSTAFDISTAVFSHRFLVNGQDTSPRGLVFNPDGTKMYVTGDVGNDVSEYDLSTAFDVLLSSVVFVSLNAMTCMDLFNE